MIPGDPICRVLYIDLDKRRFRTVERPDLIDEALGGSGIGIRLLSEECPPGADPLGPENPIILAVGPFTCLFPMASKTVAFFKSPHTGNLGESHAGGRSAVALRMAGYGAVVIRGASAAPVYLVIGEDGVKFRDAAGIWGMENANEVGSILRQREGGTGARTILRIGRAGERKVSYACVIADTFRHFGRLGLGAVFGSKNLKAVVAMGRQSFAAQNKPGYIKVYDEIFKAATQSSLMKKYHDLGTSMNVLPVNEMGALPTRNLQSGRFEGAPAISGESFAQNYLGRRTACSHCPVACIHIAALRTPHPKEAYFYKTTMIGYDHEPIYALGSMLGVEDPPGCLRLMDEVEVQGLDCMTAGVVLAWATEAFAKGLISTEDTDGVDLQWGGWQEYIRAIRRIVTQPTDLYRALARGADHAASVYGGKEFALSFGGNEMAGYHTGAACHVGNLVGARQSHLDAGGYAYDQKLLMEGQAPTAEGVSKFLLEEERWRQVLSSLVVCFFSRGVYTKDVVHRALEAAGYPGLDLDRLGIDTLARKNAFKLREGFDPAALRIPQRILETASPHGKIDEDLMRRSIEAFYRQQAP